jgi:DNA-binding response OmpR family regulator
MESKLLVVDDEVFVRELLAEYFTKLNYQVRTAGSAAEALQQVETESFHAALIDLRMPDGGGIDVLRAVKQTADDLSIVIMTGYPTVDSAIEAMRAGAFDYVVKPFRLKELDDIVAKAVATQRHRAEASQLRERVTELEARVASLRKREHREGVEVGPRRFTIVEKAVEGEPFEIEQPALSGPQRHCIREVTRQDPLYEEAVASRREFRGKAVSLLEESS